MRTTLVLGLLAFALIATGCSNNSSPDHLLGPNSTAQLSGSVTPPDPSTPPDVTPAIYGMVSDLNTAAGTFTLVSPAGDTTDVMTSSNTVVLYEGMQTTDLTTSDLQDGQYVTVTGVAAGLPQMAQMRAMLIVINSSLVNQNLN